MRWLRLGSFVLLTLVALTATERHAPPAEASAGYIIVNLADTNDIAPVSGGAKFIGFNNSIALSDGPEILFWGTDGTKQGLYAASAGGTLRAVALEGDTAPGTGGGTFPPHFSSRDISPGGDVAFSSLVNGAPGDLSGIFIASTSGISTRVLATKPTPEGTLDSVGGGCDGLAINTAGDVAFFGVDWFGLNYRKGLYLASVGGVNQVAIGPLNVPIQWNISTQALNDGGQVSFLDGGLRVGSSTAVQVGDTAPGTGGGTFAGFGQCGLGVGFAPAINNGGEVAFFADVSGGTATDGVFLKSGGSVSAVAVEGQSGPGGGTFTWGTAPHQWGRPAINNSSSIAFMAQRDVAAAGIFVKSGSTLEAVAVSGESAPGTAGGSLQIGPASTPDINNKGEIAFYAGVSGGNTTQGIFLALPEQGDTDGDGVANASDNCMLVANANQANADGDAEGDACDPDDDNDGVLDAAPDNCPAAANPGQENADGDALGDACDGCPAAVTPWVVPPDDNPDCDGFPRTTQQGMRGPESFIGTDPDVACGVNAWPVDNNDDHKAGLSDILRYIPVFGTTGPGLPYQARYDLNADNQVGLQDILMFIPFFNLTCTP